MNISKAILGVFCALFAAATFFAAVFFVQMQREMAALRAQESLNQRRLAEAEARLRAQEKFLDQVQHDPALVERLIREKLGYAKPQEFVFRFENKTVPARP